MRTLFLLRIVGLLGLTLAVIANSWADEKPATSPPPQKTPAADPAVQELLDIRKALGATPLQGTLFAEPEAGGSLPGQEQIFAETLRQLQRQGAALPAQRPSLSPVLPPLATPALESKAEPSRSVVAQAKLRMTARQLDELAANLEESALYLEADRLRDEAQLLRLAAREIDTTAAAPGRTPHPVPAEFRRDSE